MVAVLIALALLPVVTLLVALNWYTRAVALETARHLRRRRNHARWLRRRRACRDYLRDMARFPVTLPTDEEVDAMARAAGLDGSPF